MVNNEVYLQKLVAHDGVVKVLNTFEDHSYFYIVLELCNNGDLYRHFNFEAPLRPKIPEGLKKKKIILKLLETLVHLHEKNVVHCDIKLGNILLDDDFNPKLADFGLSRHWSPAIAKLETQKFGTLYYQSPEQIRGTPGWFSPKIDCWGFGIILFIILEGKHPFKAPCEEIEPNTFRDRVLHQRLTFSKTANLKYVQIVSSLLEKDPSKRLSAKLALDYLNKRETVKRPLGPAKESSTIQSGTHRPLTNFLREQGDSHNKYYGITPIPKNTITSATQEPWSTTEGLSSEAGKEECRHLGSLASTRIASMQLGQSLMQSSATRQETSIKINSGKFTSIDGQRPDRFSDFIGTSSTSALHGPKTESAVKVQFGLLSTNKLSRVHHLDRATAGPWTQQQHPGHFSHRNKLLVSQDTLELEDIENKPIFNPTMNPESSDRIKLDVDRRKLAASLGSKLTPSAKRIFAGGSSNNFSLGIMSLTADERIASCATSGLMKSYASNQAARSHREMSGSVSVLKDIKLPVINAQNLLARKIYKKDYGNVVITGDGQVVLDFWKKQFKVLIKDEVVTVEMLETNKKLIYDRDNLPKRFHSLYMLAYQTVQALQEKERPSRSLGQEDRLEAKELLAALELEGGTEQSKHAKATRTADYEPVNPKTESASIKKVSALERPGRTIAAWPAGRNLMKHSPRTLHVPF